MSIVQEALKKAGGLKASDSGQGSDNPNKKNFAPAVLLVVFIVLLGFTIKQFSFSPAKNGAKTGLAITEAIYKPISSIDKKAAEPPVAEPYTNSAGKTRVVNGKFPDFILNGIMQLVDGPRAIINNVIVATGDIIGGATVKKIDKDKVILQKKDSIVTLGME